MTPDEYRSVMNFRTELAEILVEFTKDDELAYAAADRLMDMYIIKNEGDE